ncbi:MAG: hypothetical protein RR668_09365, partial [Algoriella sp.]
LWNTITYNPTDPGLKKYLESKPDSLSYKTINLFTIKNFFGLFSIFLSFYIAISALFSQFLKKRVF